MVAAPSPLRRHLGLPVAPRQGHSREGRMRKRGKDEEEREWRDRKEERKGRGMEEKWGGSEVGRPTESTRKLAFISHKMAHL